jgi:hypothetical protein
VAPQPAAPASQLGRFGQPVTHEQTAFSAPKPFESFGHAQQSGGLPAQAQFEGTYLNQNPQSAQGQSLPQAQQQPAQQQSSGPFSSAPNDYSSFYATDNRNPYNYYGGYNQQQASQGQQDSNPVSQQQLQQRGVYNGYNAAGPQNDNLSQYPQSSSHHVGSRFGGASTVEAQNSGTTTPNPPGTQAQPAAAAQSAQGQSQGQQQPHDYPYTHPYFSSPYYAAYMNYPNGFGQGGYGGAPYGKGNGGYGQPHQYAMQGPHGYASTPAAGFGQSSLRSESGAAAGLGDYGRAGAAQASGQQGLSGSGFGGMHDTFARGGSAYQSQAAQSYGASATQAASGPAGDDLKTYGDAKGAAGPNSSLGNAARPGSAANNAGSQSGLPPSQSNQQGALGGMGSYGSYGNHLQGQGMHGNQSSTSGYGNTASGSQNHQNNNYGGAYGGAQGFGGYYNQQQQQQQQQPHRGGWGSNYH